MRVAVFGAAIVLAAIGYWTWTRPGPQERTLDTASPRNEPAPAPTDPLAAITTMETPERETAQVPAQADANPTAVQAEPARAVKPPRPVAARAQPPCTFMAMFVKPDGRALEVKSASAELESADGDVRRFESQNQTYAACDALMQGTYTLRVAADGFAHRAETVEIALRTERAKVVLWPPGWVAVIVTTPEGRPLGEVASQLKLEPKRVFTRAFEARVRRDRADPATPSARGDDLATFRPAAGSMWEMGPSCIGSLELHAEPPLWITAIVHGTELGPELLPPGAREIAFALDAHTLASALASVTLRVIDGDGQVPRGATISLRASIPAHRRLECQDLTPDREGRATFTRVVAGRYQLRVVTPVAVYQARFDLAPGEARDLGDISIHDRGRLSLRFVYEDGRSFPHQVSVAPYTPGERIEDAYVPAAAARELSIPMPMTTSILRANPPIDSHADPSRKFSTRNVRLDPDHPPKQPLVLVVYEARDVYFALDRADVASFDIFDDVEVLVATLKAAGAHGLHAKLVPGRYRARLHDKAGTAVGEAPFEVGDQSSKVTLR